MSHNHNRAWHALQSTSLSGAVRHKPVKARQCKLVLAKLKAMSLSFRSVAHKACDLLIGEAQIIWQIAWRSAGEQHASHLHHSFPCTAVHLACPIHTGSQGQQPGLRWAALPEHGEVAMYLALLLGGCSQVISEIEGPSRRTAQLRNALAALA